MSQLDQLLCLFCHSDPFEYVTVDEGKVPVAISCCERAIDTYYKGLIKLDRPEGRYPPQRDGPLLPE